MDVGSASGPDDHVGHDLAQVDWAATPLGASSDWPQSLRTAVSILLSSRFPMWMAWGPELTFFCNDAYRRDTLGRKYPWALGRPAREVWAEIWDDIGPRIDRVLATAEATWDEALLLFLERSGYPEETYHTFSYSPLRDDAGHVVGMLCVVSEDTDRVIGERRMSTLRHLGSDPSVVRTEREMLAFTARQLDRNPLDLPFTLTYLFDDDGTARLAGSTGMAAGHPAAPAVLPAGALGGLARRRAGARPLGVGRPRRRTVHRPAGRRMAGPTPPRAGHTPAGAGRYAVRLPGRGAQPLPPVRRRLPRLHRPGRRPHRDRDLQRPQLPRTAAPGRGTRPSWTGPRRRSSPTSATSSARRSP